jgi:hypothetical protein
MLMFFVHRDVFRELSIDCGYVSCLEFDRPRTILKAILDGLKVHHLDDNCFNSCSWGPPALNLSPNLWQ